MEDKSKKDRPAVSNRTQRTLPAEMREDFERMDYATGQLPHELVNDMAWHQGACADIAEGLTKKKRRQITTDDVHQDLRQIARELEADRKATQGGERSED